jgi:hypothetical protein
MSRKSPFGASLSVECLEGRATPSAALVPDPGVYSLTFNGQTTPAATSGGSEKVYTITFGGSLLGSVPGSEAALIINPFSPSEAPDGGKTLEVESWSWGDGK